MRRLFASLLLVAPSLAAADNPPAFPAPTLAALPITDTIVVDGVLDEPAWQKAAVGTGFRQRLPKELEPATEETEIRILYTADTLYVGVKAFDSQPAKIVAKEMGQDVQLWRDDSLFLLLDTFHDRRNAYVFETNPNASRTDGLVTDEGRVWSTDWDGVWDVGARIVADGWVAEFAIPFSTLRFDPTREAWGLQLRRTLRRANEISFWAPIGRDADVFRMSRAGRLEGLAGLRQGRALRVKPYISGSSRQHAEGPPGAPPRVVRGEGEDFEAGLDLKWGITRGMSLDVTVNTDFAETEVDEQRINLNRFSLFFPERREFFLENAGIFEYGPQLDTEDPLFQAFFSRRIGIVGGQPTPLDFGLRLAGRQGPWSLGLLGARTGELAPLGDLPGAPQTDWGVLRVKRNLGERSNLGLIATSREDGDGGYNRVLGFDGEWKPNDRLSFWGYGIGSEGPGSAGDDGSAGFGAQYADSNWSWSLGAAHLGNQFNPEAGFLLRTGNVYSGRVEYERQSERPGINETSSSLRAAIHTFEDGELETIDANLAIFAISLASGDYAEVFTQYRFENIVEEFELAPGAGLPVGEYSWADVGIYYETSPSRPVAFEGWLVRGDFFDGRRFAGEVTATYRPSKFLRTKTTFNHTEIDLVSDAFVAEVLRQRIDVALSPDLAISAFFQRASLAELASLNLRLAWHYRPGSDFFVVFSQSWDSPSYSQLIDRDRQVIVKLTYAWDT